MSQKQSRWNIFFDVNRFLVQLFIIFIILFFFFGTVNYFGIENLFAIPFEIAFIIITPEGVLNLLLLALISAVYIYYRFTRGKDYMIIIEYKPEEFQINPIILPYDTKYGVRRVEGIPLKAIGDKHIVHSSISGSSIELVDWFRPIYDKNDNIIEWNMKYSDTMALTPLQYLSNVKAIKLHAKTERTNQLELQMYRGSAEREITSMVTYFLEFILKDIVPEFEFSSEIPKSVTLLYDRLHEEPKPLDFMNTEDFKSMVDNAVKGLLDHKENDGDENDGQDKN